MITKRRRILACSSAAVLVTTGYFITSRLLVESAIQTAIPADSRQILDRSEQLILYSLDPHPENMTPREVNGRHYFHDTLILGQKLVTDPKTRAELLTAFYKGIREGNGDKMACFDPRYGIHAVRNGHTVDLVICYECLNVEIYDRHGLRGISTSRSPLSAFNRIGKQ